MSFTILPANDETSDGATLLIPPLVRRVSGPLKDTRQRGLHDLRISVTDRCNFRCTYCMPRSVFNERYSFLPHEELLTFEEIVRVAKVFHRHGAEKIRLTGGEPLLRHGIETLVGMLRTALPEADLTLTTNGSLLKAKAGALKAAGLDRVTVSLDSLDDATFRAMSDADVPVARVLEAIDAASAAGLAPVKINMVIKRGINDTHVLEMARRFKGSGHIVRFIEFMDVGATNHWSMSEVVPSAEIVRRIHAVFPCEPASPHYTGEVAQRWRYLDGTGEFGVISSVTQAFCSTCTRARLSTDGTLYTCLFAQKGYALKPLLRDGGGDEEISRAVQAIWQQRADNYSEVRTEETAKLRKVEMSYIGG